MVTEKVVKKLRGLLIPAEPSDIHKLPMDNLVKIPVRNQERFAQCVENNIPMYKEYTQDKDGVTHETVYILVTFDTVMEAAHKIYK